jgi:hypothetical protein
MPMLLVVNIGHSRGDEEVCPAYFLIIQEA